MKKIFNLRTAFHFGAISLLLISLLLTFFKYDFSAIYFAKLLPELGKALAFFGLSFIGKKPDVPDNNALMSIEGLLEKVINIDLTEFIAKFEKIKLVFGKKEAFILYNYYVLYYFIFTWLIICILFLFWTIIEILLENFLFSPSAAPGKETPALKGFKKFIEHPLKVTFAALKMFLSKFFSIGIYKWLFILIWLFNFNVINVFLEFFIFYFVFCFSASLQHLGSFLLKLLFNILLVLLLIPWYVKIPLFIYIFDKLRRKIGMLVLKYHQEHNKEFLKDSAKDLLVTGPIRFGKTKLISYLSIIGHMLFKDQAYDSIFKFKREFPDFPFWKLERELDLAIQEGKIKGPHSAAKFIKVKRRIFDRTEDRNVIYGYQGDLYFNDSCRYCYLFEELEEFAKVYFVYSLKCPMIIANLSIRVDSKVVSIGNFPLIDNDVLSRSAEEFDDRTAFCKILDWDILRYGNHMDENNKFIGSYEFGINVYSENDKERGNKLTNSHMKASDEEVNPLNDKLAIGMKTIGHASTYDFKTYYLSLADSQRPDSLNADERELRDKLTITNVVNNRLTMPLYIEGIFLKKINSFYKEFDKELSFFGNEAFTLPSYIMNHFFSALHNYDLRVYKSFGYSDYTIEKERACNHDSGESEKIRIPVPNKIAHNQLYATDCFNSFFGEFSEKTPYGIMDYPEYSSLKPSFDELSGQHSRLIEELKSNFKIDEE